MRTTSLLAALAATAALSAAPAQAATTWITIGEQAFMLLAAKAPPMRVLDSRRVGVTVPQLKGSSTLVQGSERVLAVELDESALDDLIADVHGTLHRCGGFIQHASEAEARAVLHRLQNQSPSAIVPNAPSYAIDSQAQVLPRLPLLQASNILSTITALSSFQNRRYNSSHGVNASNWLLAQWSAMNPGNRRSVRVSQFRHAAWAQPSVEFVIGGSDAFGEVVVIGAHLDSINGGAATAETQRAPGADDDASGVATMTEILRVLLSTGYQPRRTIRFIAYAAEEIGLRGSQDIVAAQAGRRERVVGVMQLDMTAYRGNAPNDIYLYTDYTNPAQNQFVADLAATYLPELTVGYDRCGYGCSDHASWHNAGYIASFPFESNEPNYNRTLHSVNDTTATFGNQAEHALKFAKLGLAYLVELASDAPPPVAPVAPAAGSAKTATAAASRQR